VALPKSVTPHRIEENLAVFDFSLTDAQVAAISALARGQRLISPPFAPAWDPQ
jgi:diketogulonate reductase-like aldo/keto reductase